MAQYLLEREKSCDEGMAMDYTEILFWLYMIPFTAAAVIISPALVTFPQITDSILFN